MTNIIQILKIRFNQKISYRPACLILIITSYKMSHVKKSFFPYIYLDVKEWTQTSKSLQVMAPPPPQKEVPQEITALSLLLSLFCFFQALFKISLSYALSGSLKNSQALSTSWHFNTLVSCRSHKTFKIRFLIMKLCCNKMSYSNFSFEIML